MEVKRPDIFDFEIKLSEQEFTIVKFAADGSDMSIEQIIKLLLENEITRIKDGSL